MIVWRGQRWGLMERWSLLLLLVALSGCSLSNPRLYDGPERPMSEQGVISSLGLYSDRKLTLRVTAIDGKPVPALRSASFLVLPGVYSVKLHVIKDLHITNGPTGGLGVALKEADLEIQVDVKAGHTYIPNANEQADHVSAFFDDKGKDYPQECLPLYREVNENSNPGFALYKDNRSCNI